MPDAAQWKALFADLAKIDPDYTGARAANAAMKVCHSILSESKEPLQITAAQSGFAGAARKPVTDAQAKKIITAVKRNGFCKK